ncbi:hypothetical protein BLNAU_8990 [Blattamonas nauphoetae]|uniref:Uncharacterized protein n=1 Tax=Blattamonas nauphoetae TaxID=2049346 RepID=A0ABQ9XX23_9EUKA|nr:hypothetical protein BLNAU_8990 [Blattamonas nauphoetae]
MDSPPPTIHTPPRRSSSQQHSQADNDLSGDLTLSPLIQSRSIHSEPEPVDRAHYLRAVFQRVKIQQNKLNSDQFQALFRHPRGSPPSHHPVLFMAKRDFVIKFSAFQSRFTSFSRPSPTIAQQSMQDLPLAHLRQVNYPLYHPATNTNVAPFVVFETATNLLRNLALSQMFAYRFHHYNRYRSSRQNLRNEMVVRQVASQTPNHVLNRQQSSPEWSLLLQRRVFPTLLTSQMICRFPSANYLNTLPPTIPQTEMLEDWFEAENQMKLELPRDPMLTRHAHLPSRQARGQRVTQMSQMSRLRRESRTEEFGSKACAIITSRVISVDVANSMQATSPSLSPASIFASPVLHTSPSLHRFPYRNTNHIDTEPQSLFGKMDQFLDRWTKDEVFRLQLSSLVFPFNFSQIVRSSLVNKTPDEVQYFTFQQGMDDREDDVIRNHAYARGENLFVDEQELDRREKDEEALKQRWMQTSQIHVPTLPDKDTNGLSLPQLLKTLPIRPSDHSPFALLTRPTPAQILRPFPPPSPTPAPRHSGIWNLLNLPTHHQSTADFPMMSHETGTYPPRAHSPNVNPTQNESESAHPFYVRFSYFGPSVDSLHINPNNPQVQAFTYTQRFVSLPHLLFDEGLVRNEKKALHDVLKATIDSNPYKKKVTLNDFFYGNGVGSFRRVKQHWDPLVVDERKQEREERILTKPIDPETMQVVRDTTISPGVNEEKSQYGQIDGIWLDSTMHPVVEEDSTHNRAARIVRIGANREPMPVQADSKSIPRPTAKSVAQNIRTRARRARDGKS